MPTDIPIKQKENIEIVFAFEKNSIDISYMAGEHLKPLKSFNPSIFNLIKKAITTNSSEKNSSHQH